MVVAHLNKKKELTKTYMAARVYTNHWTKKMGKLNLQLANTYHPSHSYRQRMSRSSKSQVIIQKNLTAMNIQHQDSAFGARVS